MAQGLDWALASGANVSSYFARCNLLASAMPQALTQLAGVVHTSVGSFGSTAGSQFVNSLTDPNWASTRVRMRAPVRREKEQRVGPIANFKLIEDPTKDFAVIVKGGKIFKNAL